MKKIIIAMLFAGVSLMASEVKVTVFDKNQVPTNFVASDIQKICLDGYVFYMTTGTAIRGGLSQKFTYINGKLEPVACK